MLCGPKQLVLLCAIAFLGADAGLYDLLRHQHGAHFRSSFGPGIWNMPGFEQLAAFMDTVATGIDRARDIIPLQAGQQVFSLSWKAGGAFSLIRPNFSEPLLGNLADPNFGLDMFSNDVKSPEETLFQDYTSIPGPLKAHPAVAATQLNYNAWNGSRVAALAANLFYIEDKGKAPYVSFGATGDVPFLCSAVPKSGVETLQCTAADDRRLLFHSRAAVLPLAKSNGDARSLILEYSSSSSRQTVNLALYMTLWRARNLENAQDMILGIREDVDDRRSHSRGVVGWLWFLTAVLFLLLTLVTALWSNWALGAVAPKVLLRYHVIFWVVLTVLISSLWGLAGMLVALMVMSLTDIGLSIAYCALKHRGLEYLRNRRRSKAAVVELVESGSTPATAAAAAPAEATPAPATRASAPSIVARPDFQYQCTEFCKFRGEFRYLPIPYGMPQKRIYAVHMGSFLIVLLTWLVTFAAWTVDDYPLFNRLTQEREVEFVPESVAKAVASVYVYDGWATRLKVNNFLFVPATTYCESTAHAKLTLAEKEVQIKQDFVDKYSIDMTQYHPSDWREYKSVNEWFVRALAPNTRQLAYPGDDKVIVSPADARVMLFHDWDPDVTVWIKGDEFTVVDLIQGHNKKNNIDGEQFRNGASLAIVRLAPQDYHRFHSPVAGKVTQIEEIDDGTLHSVNMDGMTSENLAIYNKRTVVMLDTVDFGPVAFVSIGAACVGKTTMELASKSMLAVDQKVARGDQLGKFEFGGSTIALVFKKGAVEFDQDVLLRSRNRVETYLHVRDRIGVKASHTPDSDAVML